MTPTVVERELLVQLRGESQITNDEGLVVYVEGRDLLVLVELCERLIGENEVLRKARGVR